MVSDTKQRNSLIQQNASYTIQPTNQPTKQASNLFLYKLCLYQCDSSVKPMTINI